MLLRWIVRWAGHVSRMSNSRIPKQLLYGELSRGSRKVGGQRKRYIDSFKAYLKEFNIDVATWETTGSDRPAWRKLIHSGAIHSENQRSDAAKDKPRTRKARAGQSTNMPSSHWCPTCGRGCHARIGLTNHLRIHRPAPKHFILL